MVGGRQLTLTNGAGVGAYEAARARNLGFETGRGLALDEVPTGGIVGSMSIVECTTANASVWFRGPFGVVLRGAKSLPFRVCRGRLGFFEPQFHEAESYTASTLKTMVRATADCLDEGTPRS
jgi:hypothetical protein